MAQLPRLNSGFKFQRQRQLIQKKRARVKLPKLCREECPNCEGLNIFFNEVTTIECHNCQHAIGKGHHGIALNTQECEVEQDVE